MNYLLFNNKNYRFFITFIKIKSINNYQIFNTLADS